MTLFFPSSLPLPAPPPPPPRGFKINWAKGSSTWRCLYVVGNLTFCNQNRCNEGWKRGPPPFILISQFIQKAMYLFKKGERNLGLGNHCCCDKGGKHAYINTHTRKHTHKQINFSPGQSTWAEDWQDSRVYRRERSKAGK